MTRNPATSHLCTCAPADVDPRDFGRVIGHADTAALTAVRAHTNPAPRKAPITASSTKLTATHATLVVCDPNLAEWLIHDGRARRDQSDQVRLDTRPLHHLPDIIDGGAPALDAYVNAFAAALTLAGFSVHVITHHTTHPRSLEAPAREPPDATQLSTDAKA